MTSFEYGFMAERLLKAVVWTGVLALMFLVASPGLAGAQTVYPYGMYDTYNAYPYSTYSTYNAYPTYAIGNCAYLSTDLSLGSRGSEVLALQQFLVLQNYPGAGSWMLTSYFGRATEAAVRNFQRSRGLLQTGIVDRQTRESIQQYSCGTSGYQDPSYYPYQNPPVYPYQYSSPYQYPTSYPYSPYSYGYGVPLRIDSLSPQSGIGGSSLTLYGSGFDKISNTVRFGANAAVGAGSTNGTSLTLTVPNMPPGVYGVYITNGHGVSNSLAFTVTGYSSGYYGYYNHNYNYNCPSYSYPYGCY